MTGPSVVRSAAFLMAAIGVIDPAWTTSSRGPVPVEVRSGLRHDAAGNQEGAVLDLRNRLSREIGNDIDLDSASKPAAIVLAEGRVDVESIPGATPVSAVITDDPPRPGVSVVSVRPAGVVRSGWSSEIVAVVKAHGMAQKTTVVVLEENGVELGSIQQHWQTDEETRDVRLTYLPPSAGIHTLRVLVRALDVQPEAANHVALEATVNASDRPLEVLVHEPRPSWLAAFVRRVLETDPDFHVSALARTSKGLEMRGGQPPSTLSSATLAGFDAVVVGAPEDLQSREVDALESFARRRGGAVIFVPDRRPSGEYLRIVRAREFEESLLQSPATISTRNGLQFHGSEIVVPRQISAGVDALAEIPHGDSSRPVVLSWPLGDGRVVFSGALDAWRYRAPNSGFAMFWRAAIGAAAVESPAPLELALDRAAVAPGETVVLHARVRRTEFDDAASSASLPAIAGRLIGTGGQDQSVRLWPSLEIGEFEARFVAPAAGRYDLHVTAGGQVSADTVLVVSESAGALPASGDALRSLAAATGGVTVTNSDLSPLIAHLRALPRASVSRSVHPARSFWWMIGFVALVSTEWAVRRRRGFR
jgi:hypothetical protein